MNVCVYINRLKLAASGTLEFTEIWYYYFIAFFSFNFLVFGFDLRVCLRFGLFLLKDSIFIGVSLCDLTVDCDCQVLVQP